MKKKFGLLVYLIPAILAFSINVSAQGELPKSQLFLMHEDEVLPYKADQYESALKDFVKMFSDAKIENRTYNIVQGDYFTYTAVIPVTDFKGLAEYFGMTPDIIKKIGQDKFDAQMKKFDGCYDTHRNYLLTLRNDLSYKPEYALNPDDGINFRHFDYLYAVPGKEDEMTALLQEWKALYESKKIEQGYRVYMGSVGTENGMVLLVQPAKSRADWAILSDKQDEILGEESQKLWERTMEITQKFEHKNAMMRPDLSLRPKK
jgi:hypothetical protein